MFKVGKHYRITSMGLTTAVGPCIRVTGLGAVIRLSAWTADAMDRDCGCHADELRPATRAEINEANKAAKARRAGW